MYLKHWVAALLAAFGLCEMGCSTTTRLEGEVSPETVMAIKWRHQYGHLNAEAQNRVSGERIEGALMEIGPTHTLIASRGRSLLLVHNAHVTKVSHVDRGWQMGAGIKLGLLVGVIAGGWLGAATYTNPCEDRGNCFDLFGAERRAVSGAALGALLFGVSGGAVGHFTVSADDYVFGAAPAKGAP